MTPRPVDRSPVMSPELKKQLQRLAALPDKETEMTVRPDDLAPEEAARGFCLMLFGSWVLLLIAVAGFLAIFTDLL